MENKFNQVVIVAAARTPIGSYKGFLKNIKGIKMIELPGFEEGKKIIKINGKVCKWDTHDQNNKNLTDGHYIISASCFEPYIQVIKVYITSRMN